MPVEVPGFVIHSHPRSKKNSPRIVTIPAKGAHRCRACGHIKGFPRVLPSEAFEAWETQALRELLEVKAHLRSRGVELPITDPVGIEALFYITPHSSGAMRLDAPDLGNLMAALADTLEKAEVIANDRQIADWDGSRRLLDGANPRIEVFISILEVKPKQEGLPL
jgi:Holliday junction resolvase RusA-like endonuclease